MYLCGVWWRGVCLRDRFLIFNNAFAERARRNLKAALCECSRNARVRPLTLRRINYENQLPVFLTLAVSLIINLLKRALASWLARPKSRTRFIFVCDLACIHKHISLLFASQAIPIFYPPRRQLFISVYCALTCKFFAPPRARTRWKVMHTLFDILCDCTKLLVTEAMLVIRE